MSVIRPFKGWSPPKRFATEVASFPYDVVSYDEAKALIEENEKSFLRIVRSDAEFSPSEKPDLETVMARAKSNLELFRKEGYLVQKKNPVFYLYEVSMGTHSQLGLVAGVSIDEYEQNLVKKHEFTRQEKENERALHVQTLKANTGPVFLTFRNQNALANRMRAISDSYTPELSVTKEDGITHRVWSVEDPALIQELTSLAAELPCLYIADGHHRAAAAFRSGLEFRKQFPEATKDAPFNTFLAVLFPDDQLKILDYNRVVKDLNGLSPEAFLARVSEKFEVSVLKDDAGIKPQKPGQFAMRLSEKWYRLVAKPELASTDVVACLDVSILQTHLLDPILGITDPRKSDRIDFIGGIRGLSELEKKCRNGYEVAFALYPTSIQELLDVADSGRVMPPKSTWFEPKLRSGLVIKDLVEE